MPSGAQCAQGCRGDVWTCGELSRGSCWFHVRAGIRGMPRSLVGRILVAAGGAYEGQYEAVLGPARAAARPARSRLEQARVVAGQVERIALEAHSRPVAQAALTILRQSVSRALDYDFCLLSESASQQYAMELEDLVGDAALRVLAIPTNAPQSVRRQLMRPTALTGLGFPRPTRAARVGRLTRLASILPAVRQTLSWYCPEASGDALRTAVDYAEAEGTQAALAAEGLEIAACGGLAAYRRCRQFPRCGASV